MSQNFKNALQYVLASEGAWSDHPQDPGGATMKGITLAVFQRHFGREQDKPDLRNISDQQLEHIYRSDYWNKCRCDDLPAGLDYSVFDAAVNSGPARAAKWLQESVGAAADGVIGELTLAGLKEQNTVDVINKSCDARLSFLKGLSTWDTFGKGWGKRVESVRQQAVAMTSGNHYEMVRLGSTGEWVKKLQMALGINASGTFDQETYTALCKQQAELGLQADGIAGRNTYRALGLIQ